MRLKNVRMKITMNYWNYVPLSRKKMFTFQLLRDLIIIKTASVKSSESLRKQRKLKQFLKLINLEMNLKKDKRV